MAVEKDRLITEALVLQLVVEITAVTAGFSHSCQKQPLWQRFRRQWFLGNGSFTGNGYDSNGTGPRGQRIRNQTLINRCNPSTEVKFCAFMGI